jgi:hypothetical protein
VDLGLRAEANRRAMDTATMSDIVATNWSLAVVDGCVVGYFVNANMTWIASMKVAASMVRARHEYFNSPKERRGGVPPKVGVPAKYRAGFDYWDLWCPWQCADLVSMVFDQAEHMSLEFARYVARRAPPSFASLSPFLTAWATIAHLGGEQVILYPSLFWEHIDDGDLVLTRRRMDEDGVLLGSLDGDDRPITQFNRYWGRRAAHGVIPEWHSVPRVLYRQFLEDAGADGPGQEPE